MKTIYIVSLVLIALTSFELISKNHRTAVSQRYAWNVIWLAFSLTVFALASFRVGGSDWENYEIVFNLAASSDSLPMAFAKNPLLEPGYVALNYLVAKLGGDRRDLIYIESGITSLGTFLVLTRVPGGAIIVTWLITLTFIGLMPVRQTVAISLVMIAFAATSRKLRLISTLIAPSIHISSIPLLVAKQFGKKHLSRSALTGLALMSAVATYFTTKLLSDKLALYRDEASGLTDLAPGTVIGGKIVTLSFIVLVGYFASKKKQTAPCPSFFDYKILHLITIVSLAMATINPGFIRLTSVFEILYMWIAAENIYYLQNKKIRFFLYSMIAFVVICKLTKISLQFEDIYSVRFFSV
ncbi:EpsG family protein [Geobacter sp. AOG2]|uniref:EpsG family protein n=1 Tax=Geobacter sp. AOG2 TaxID=1566347 RepID=UPI001CC5E949|nr:EpsG family protein [Geobacter sp. AOG2]GFE62255.1 hypothetical protein AOG2_28430 [Geobacter sp. AOG2]